MDQAITQYQFTLQQAVDEWLAQKKNRTGSEKTVIAYKETVQQFRDTLKNGELDMLSNPIDVARVAALWAGLRSSQSRLSGEVSPSTYNQRLAILSSFYTFLTETYEIEIINPIKHIKKRPVQAYASAMPLESEETALGLAGIDRSTLQGKRDYTLLLIALVTGRRASELVDLRWRHVKITGKRVMLTFEHCKGGKIMRDLLDTDVSRVLMQYLHAIYGAQLGSNPDAPLWISFSKQNSGNAISTHTLNDLCERYFGTGKIHALRHTFAVEMEKAGAPISEISARLGHTNEKITSIYLKQARGAENPFAGKLSSRFGVEKE